MRLIATGGDLYLAEGSHLIEITNPELAEKLLDRVLVVEIASTAMPVKTIRSVRKFSSEGSDIVILAFANGEETTSRISPSSSCVLATFTRGRYNDKWTRPEFDLEVVVLGGKTAELELSLYLPPIPGAGEKSKELSIESNGKVAKATILRDQLNPLAFSVTETSLFKFSVTPEPRQNLDERSLGCVIHNLSSRTEESIDVFSVHEFFV